MAIQGVTVDTVRDLGDFTVGDGVIQTYIDLAYDEVKGYEGQINDTTTLKWLNELLAAHLLRCSREPQLTRYSHEDTTVEIDPVSGEGLSKTGFGQQYQRILNRELGIVGYRIIPSV